MRSRGGYRLSQIFLFLFVGRLAACSGMWVLDGTGPIFHPERAAMQVSRHQSRAKNEFYSQNSVMNFHYACFPLVCRGFSGFVMNTHAHAIS
jgi:hypothetical protein